MTSRTLTVSGVSQYCNKDYVTRPMIRLQGKWLEKLNFSTGDKVQVITDNEQLIIKLVKE